MHDPFPQNLSILRRRAGYTQESLAEALGVSRQAVGKWESGQALPEAATLLTLADLLGCSLDQLMREELTEEPLVPAPTLEAGEDLGYQWEAVSGHMKQFALMIAFGVGLVLVGVALTVAAAAVFGETAAVALPLLFCVAGAVFLFVFGGISQENFQRQWPQVPLCPYPEEKESFSRLFRVGMAGMVSGILLDVILLVAAAAIFGENETMMCYAAAVFFLLLALCVGTIVYLGIQHDTYDENSELRRRRKGPDVEGVIMLTATAIFLLLGFVWNRWHPGWVVFPIGGILCGIVGEIKKKE